MILRTYITAWSGTKKRQKRQIKTSDRKIDNDNNDPINYKKVIASPEN